MKYKYLQPGGFFSLPNGQEDNSTLSDVTDAYKKAGEKAKAQIGTWWNNLLQSYKDAFNPTEAKERKNKESIERNKQKQQSMYFTSDNRSKTERQLQGERSDKAISLHKEEQERKENKAKTDALMGTGLYFIPGVGEAKLAIDLASPRGVIKTIGGIKDNEPWVESAAGDVLMASPLILRGMLSSYKTKPQSFPDLSPAKQISYEQPVRSQSKTYLWGQRSSKLTEAERAGIPKGERNNIRYRPHNYGNLVFIKNYSGVPIMSNGKVRISPSDNLLANMTSDVPFRLHSYYSEAPGTEYLIINPRGLRGQTPLSIEPSDTFFPNTTLFVDPKYVKVLTGNTEVIPKLEKEGIQVLTSPELQKASSEAQLYRDAVDKYITENIGRSSLKDYRHLELMTGLKAGVTPNTGQLNNYIKLFNDMDQGLFTLDNIPDPAFVYPNGRELNISHFIPKGGQSALDQRLIIPYKNVFYDPTTWAESDITARMSGMHALPKYSEYGGNGIDAINKYIQEHNIRPLRKNGGKLNK